MKFILYCILFSPITVLSQELNLPFNSNNLVEYSSVITVDSTDAKTLYSRAKLFIVNTFKSGKEVTQLNDDDTKTIVAKGLIPVYVKALGKTYSYGDFTVKINIQCKEGRYKYSYSEFYHQNKSSQYNGSGGNIENEKPACGYFLLSKKNWAAIKAMLDEKVKEIIDYMVLSMKSAGNKDW